MNVPPDRVISCGSTASAAMTRPGNSGEQPTAGLVTVVLAISGWRDRFTWARSVYVRPCHSDKEAQHLLMPLQFIGHWPAIFVSLDILRCARVSLQ